MDVSCLWNVSSPCFLPGHSTCSAFLLQAFDFSSVTMGSNRTKIKNAKRSVAFQKKREIEAWRERHDLLEEQWVAMMGRGYQGLALQRVLDAEKAPRVSEKQVQEHALDAETAPRVSEKQVQEHADNAKKHQKIVKSSGMGHQGVPKNTRGMGDNCGYCKAMEYTGCRCGVL